ncbi:hypothetical protein BHE74_00026093 [Ensete ventricosum]|nr:hypothetical protein BHE74_00026093 [Ensete ventricosum]
MYASSLPWPNDLATRSQSLVGPSVGRRCVPLQEDPGRAVGARSSPSDDQYLTRCQPPTIRSTIGWSTYRIGSAMPPTVDCQGHYSLVGSTRLLCHATSRLLSRALFAGQPNTFALPCHQPPVACYQGLCRLTTGLPIDPPEVRSAPDVAEP